MRQKSHATDLSSEEVVKGIRRATRTAGAGNSGVVLEGRTGRPSHGPDEARRG